jgi:hypothetical protein
MPGSLRHAQSVGSPAARTDVPSEAHPACTQEELMADFARDVVDYARDKFGTSRADREVLVQMIVREFDKRDGTPGMGGDVDTPNKPAEVRVVWPFYVLGAGLLALSLMAGWAGFAFMATLFGLGVVSHGIRRAYVRQSRTSSGAGVVIRALETLRCYLADEDPPPAAANRMD